MIEFYAHIKWVHVAAVIASGCLFAVRGGLVLAGHSLGMSAPARFLAYAIDTVLLTAALMLVTILPGAMFANGWLFAKLGLLVVYIFLGTFALRRGRNPHQRRLCFVLALAVYGFMIGIARTHHPLGLLHWLAQTTT